MEKFPGEYKRVYFWSKRKNLIRKANMTPITQEDAISLIRLVEEGYGLLNHNAFGKTKVVFNRNSSGRAHYRTWTIILPSKSLPEEYSDPKRYFTISPCELLRVGVVLHEISHLAAFKAFKSRLHDKLFVKMFDDILEYWEKNIFLDKERVVC